MNTAELAPFPTNSALTILAVRLAEQRREAIENGTFRPSDIERAIREAIGLLEIPVDANIAPAIAIKFADVIGGLQVVELAMAIQQGIDTAMKIVNPSTARLCEDCNNLVTTGDICDNCGGKTIPHPDADDAEGYCMECAEGPFPLRSLHLVTWAENPYVQIDEGDMNLHCRECRLAQIREDA